MRFEDFRSCFLDRLVKTSRDPDEVLSCDVVNNLDEHRYELWYRNQVWLIKPVQVENAANLGKITDMVDAKIRTVRGKAFGQPNPYAFRVQDVRQVLYVTIRKMMVDIFGEETTKDVEKTIRDSIESKAGGKKITTNAIYNTVTNGIIKYIVSQKGKLTKKEIK